MNRKICLLVLLLFYGFVLRAIDGTLDTFRIISYNVENLFDCKNDSLTEDDSFTPEGEYNWTETKYRVKINNISKAITAAGGWGIPILVGLCEVENSKVVDDLLNKTQLREVGYQFIHKDSPDLRGVDVALIYLSSHIQIIDKKFITVPILDGRPTRDILYATCLLLGRDTLHVFVNHWPSRYGGELESEYKRMAAAEVLREYVEKIFERNEFAKVVIMGDFNDYPDNESIIQGLCSIAPEKNPIFGQLYNLCYSIHTKGVMGSHKFGGHWGMLDQMIVSGALLDENNSLYVSQRDVGICDEPFLFKETSTGMIPKRAFLGNVFSYGYSDHLPIYVDLVYRKKK